MINSPSHHAILVPPNLQRNIYIAGGCAFLMLVLWAFTSYLKKISQQREEINQLKAEKKEN